MRWLKRISFFKIFPPKKKKKKLRRSSSFLKLFFFIFAVNMNKNWLINWKWRMMFRVKLFPLRHSTLPFSLPSDLIIHSSLYIWRLRSFHLHPSPSPPPFDKRQRKRFFRCRTHTMLVQLKKIFFLKRNSRE